MAGKQQTKPPPRGSGLLNIPLKGGARTTTTGPKAEAMFNAMQAEAKREQQTKKR